MPREEPVTILSIERAYLVTPVCAQPMQVVRVGDGGYRVFVPGLAAILLSGYQHILVRPPLAEVLRDLCFDDMDFRPTAVRRVSTDETWQYVEVMPRFGLWLDTRDEREAWHYDFAHLFVSSVVRDALVERLPGELTFSPGFSSFGGVSAGQD